MGQGECLLPLGDSLTWDSLETDSEMESCLWKVYLPGSSQEVHLERSRGSATGQRAVLAWNILHVESDPQGALELGSSLSQTEARGLPTPRILVSSAHWLQAAPTYSCEPSSLGVNEWKGKHCSIHFREPKKSGASVLLIFGEF